MKKYKIFKATSTYNLSNKIQNCLGEGAEIVGGPFTYTEYIYGGGPGIRTESFVFCQAMMMPEKYDYNKCREDF